MGRSRKSVLSAKAAAKQNAPSTAVDPAVEAEAVKKADVAMEALLLEEAAEQLAATAKAAKKARGRASKATAAKEGARPTASDSTEAAPSEPAVDSAACAAVNLSEGSTATDSYAVSVPMLPTGQAKQGPLVWPSG